MLEACIDRRTGEVIVVKRAGSPWSDTERDGAVLVVVELDDPDLNMQGTVRAYPYAVYGQNLDAPGSGAVMLATSRWKVDPRNLAPGKTYRRADL